VGTKYKKKAEKRISTIPLYSLEFLNNKSCSSLCTACTRSIFSIQTAWCTIVTADMNEQHGRGVQKHQTRFRCFNNILAGTPVLSHGAARQNLCSEANDY
jgi:hypothetical protein